MTRHVPREIREVTTSLSLQTILLLDHLYLTMVEKAADEHVRHAYVLQSLRSLPNPPPAAVCQCVFDWYEAGGTLTAVRL